MLAWVSRAGVIYAYALKVYGKRDWAPWQIVVARN